MRPPRDDRARGVIGRWKRSAGWSKVRWLPVSRWRSWLGAGVNANQLFHWRKLYQAGLLGTAPCEATKSDLQLLPVTVADESVHEQVRESLSAGHPQGTINIEFPGRALVSVEGQVDTDIVRAVLESLRG